MLLKISTFQDFFLRALPLLLLLRLYKKFKSTKKNTVSCYLNLVLSGNGFLVIMMENNYKVDQKKEEDEFSVKKNKSYLSKVKCQEKEC